MANYAIWIQPDKLTQFVVVSTRASEADKFADWLHGISGAAISIYDESRMTVRKTFGDFDSDRA